MNMRYSTAITLLYLLSSLACALGENPALVLPPVSPGLPGAGLKVAVTAPEYAGTAVHHMLYLPPDWSPNWREKKRTWPVMVEYTGNKYPEAGSTGQVEDAGLGFGISRGRYIWIVMPYVSADHQRNEVTWWGDTKATVDYAKTNIPRLCAEYGGDPNAVFICGFSRGAIAVNYIGLHDDEVAKLWRGFISHDHYDGVLEWKGTTWGSPLAQYRKGALKRLNRLNGRPILVCQNGGDRELTITLEDYLASRVPPTDFTLVKVNVSAILGDFPNDIAPHPHTDRWLLKDSPERRVVWRWMEQALQTSPTTTPR
jgi:hypothetical protein